MALTYQTIGVSPGATSTTCVVTKPTGLTAGDLIVAIIAVRSSSITITPASGFTADISETGQTGVQIRTFSKIADGTDAAATDFTFTLSASERNKGAIVRISGSATSSWLNTSSKNFSNSNSTTADTGTVTPSVANCMFILTSANTQSSANYSAWAMATSDPGFTEIMDAFYSDAQNIHLGIAISAIRPETTGTGNFTLTQGNETQTTIALAFAPSTGDEVRLLTLLGVGT